MNSMCELLFNSCYDDLIFDSHGTIPVLYDFKKFSYTLYGYFYTGPVCFYQLVKHATEATTSAIGLEYSNTPRIPCNEQHSYSLHQMFSSK